jgi:hypothetical protein
LILLSPDLAQGIQRIVDGDTLDIGSSRHRINGKDAPEARQRRVSPKSTRLHNASDRRASPERWASCYECWSVRQNIAAGCMLYLLGEVWREERPRWHDWWGLFSATPGLLFFTALCLATKGGTRWGSQRLFLNHIAAKIW